MPYVEVNGIQIYYEERGDGHPLVMINGLWGNLHWWMPALIESLAERFRVITFDNRGVGFSDKPTGAYSIEIMAGDTAGLIGALELGKTHILGASMGGKIALELALEHPELVDRLVLCSANCGGDRQITPRPEIYTMLGARRKGVTAEDVARSSLPLLFPEPFVKENPELMEDFIHRWKISLTPSHAFFGHLEATAAYDCFIRLPEIEAPALILTGDSDELVPTENSRILLDHIPDARYIVYENAAHFFFSQYPERVAADVIEFLLG